jgi:hypothetical protein
VKKLDLDHEPQLLVAAEDGPFEADKWAVCDDYLLARKQSVLSRKRLAAGEEPMDPGQVSVEHLLVRHVEAADDQVRLQGREPGVDVAENEYVAGKQRQERVEHPAVPLPSPPR